MAVAFQCGLSVCQPLPPVSAIPYLASQPHLSRSWLHVPASGNSGLLSLPATAVKGCQLTLSLPTPGKWPPPVRPDYLAPTWPGLPCGLPLEMAYHFWRTPPPCCLYTHTPLHTHVSPHFTSRAWKNRNLGMGRDGGGLGSASYPWYGALLSPPSAHFHALPLSFIHGSLFKTGLGGT